MSCGNEIHQERIAQRCVCCGSDHLGKSAAVLMPFVAYRAFGWMPVEIDQSWGLKDLKSGWAYSLCNSLQCQVCGFLFLDIRFDKDELIRLYNNYRSDSYAEQRETFEPGYLKRHAVLNSGYIYLPIVEAFLKPLVAKPLRILDWGGDTGINTPFRKEAELLHVYDLSDRPLVDGVQRIKEFEIVLSNRYDLIVMSHVIEHVPYPAKTLRQVAKAMSSDTLLYVEVPYEPIIADNDKSRQHYLRKKHWHEHINFFTVDALTALVERSGMRIRKMGILNAFLTEKSGNVLSVVCCKP